MAQFAVELQIFTNFSKVSMKSIITEYNFTDWKHRPLVSEYGIIQIFDLICIRSELRLALRFEAFN